MRMSASAPGRGRTRRGRLRLLDGYLVRTEAELLRRCSLFVDLGIGEGPWTTLEALDAFRLLQPTVRALGVDHDFARVAAAGTSHPDAEFRAGGLELPLRPGEEARLVRAMNVLRSYRIEEVRSLREKLAAQLPVGGLLLEGSSDVDGQVLSAFLVRRLEGAGRETTLLFATDFSRGFAPRLFRDVLPFDLRRKVLPGTDVHRLFSDWQLAWERVRDRSPGPPAEVFARSVEALRSQRGDAEQVEGLLGAGYARFRFAD